MKKAGSVLWGIILIAAGVIWALNEFNVTNINVFFDGWWTLFIIVPCAIGLFTEREKTGNIIGIAVGAFLLLCCRDILSFSMLWKLLVPAIIVIIGLKMVLAGLFGNKRFSPYIVLGFMCVLPPFNTNHIDLRTVRIEETSDAAAEQQIKNREFMGNCLCKCLRIDIRGQDIFAVA